MHNNKHIRAMLTYIWLIPLVYLLPDFFAQYLPANKLLVVIVSLTVIVPSMVYFIVPFSLYLLDKLSKAVVKYKDD